MPNIRRVCKFHGEQDFYLANKKNYWKCRKCNVERVKKRRQNVKLMAVEYKGGCCVICSYNKCVKALDFHHLNPKEKDFSISKRGHTRSWNRIKIELDKCILVCSNCHSEIHEELDLFGCSSMVEQLAVNEEAVGSSPTTQANF